MENEYQLSLTAEEIENKLKASGVQPDWHQHNSDEPDYIKNRPCDNRILYDLSVDTPQDLGIVKLWDFTRGSLNMLTILSRMLSSKNILKAPDELLEDGSSTQMFLIWIGMRMPPSTYYDNNNLLSGIYTCKSLAESEITSIGGTNYKIKLTSMDYYFVFDTTTLDADHASLFSEVGIYVQPNDEWLGLLPLQGVLQLSIPTPLNDWFIPDTVARVKNVPTKTSELENDSNFTPDALQYVSQELTEEQQMQARKNQGLYYNMNCENYLLPETTVDGVTTVSGGILDTSDFVVYVDGLRYEVVADVSYGSNYIRINFPLEDAPVTISCRGIGSSGDTYTITPLDDNTHTVAVCIIEEELECVEEKYIPHTIARNTDIKEYVDTAVANMMKLVSPSGKIFQITVDDSGALSTTEIS